MCSFSLSKFIRTKSMDLLQAQALTNVSSLIKIFLKNFFQTIVYGCLYLSEWRSVFHQTGIVHNSSVFNTKTWKFPVILPIQPWSTDSLKTICSSPNVQIWAFAFAFKIYSSAVRMFALQCFLYLIKLGPQRTMTAYSTRLRKIIQLSDKSVSEIYNTNRKGTYY